MKRILILFFILFLFYGCGSWEFVHKNETGELPLNNKTYLLIAGDNSPKFKSLISEKIGDVKSEDAVYKLSVNSEKTKSALVINEDATASQFLTEFFVSYEIYNLEEKCNIFVDGFKTESSFNAKSAGYSFGTDFSEERSTFLNIQKNVDEFMSSLNRNANFESCL
tara:strand:+ start:781 stop:1278 length:498 start_codon:yes stop_codon:yes gene_type:complete